MFLTQKSVTFNEKVAELRLITRPLIIGNKTSAVTLINIANSCLIAIERNLLLENNYDFSRHNKYNAKRYLIQLKIIFSDFVALSLYVVTLITKVPSLGEESLLPSTA